MTHPTDWQGLLTLLFFFALFVAWKLRGSWTPSTTAHGTASWETYQGLYRAGMLGKSKGLPIGRTRGGELIRAPKSSVHLSVFAPTGAGKGVSFVIPWLLSHRGSIVCIDPKGENARLTAARRRAMGQRVVMLDPFGISGEPSDTFNPLDLLGDTAASIDDARSFGEAMVVRPPEGDRDPHWNEQASNVITSILSLLLVRTSGGNRNLMTLRALATDPGKSPDKEGKGGEPDGVAKVALLLRELANEKGMGPEFAFLAGVLQQIQDRERAGVLSTLHRHSMFLDSPAISKSVSSSSFDPRELLSGNMTIFLVLPPHQLEAQARWLRLVIAAFIRLIGREGSQQKEILFILDEAATLGQMVPINQGLTLLRSYGLRLAFFFQSLGQLREVFRGNESVLLDNTDQVFFSVPFETAERVSKMLGERTLATSSWNSNASRSWQSSGDTQGRGTQMSQSEGQNVAVHGRALMKPDEVMTMNPDFFLAFFRGMRAIRARRIIWYRDSMFAAPSYFPRLPPLWWWLLLAMAGGLIVWALMGR